MTCRWCHIKTAWSNKGYCNERIAHKKQMSINWIHALHIHAHRPFNAEKGASSESSTQWSSTVVRHLLVCELLMQGAFSTNQPPEKPRNKWACGASHSLTCSVAQVAQVSSSERQWRRLRMWTWKWQLYASLQACWCNHNVGIILSGCCSLVSFARIVHCEFGNSCLHQMHQMFSIVIRMHILPDLQLYDAFRILIECKSETLQRLYKIAALLGPPNRVHPHKLICESPKHQN